MNLDCLLREILLRFSVLFLSAMRISQIVLLLVTIVLSATSSASSEDTPSTHKIGRISAEVFPDDDESSRIDVVMSLRTCLSFFSAVHG